MWMAVWIYKGGQGELSIVDLTFPYWIVGDQKRPESFPDVFLWQNG